MSGPLPVYRPLFPAAFVEQAQRSVRQRTVAYQLRQRARLVLLLEADPLLSNLRAAAAVHLHPNAVRYWRRRWALGEFGLADAPGRGRKSGFSPAGASSGQSHSR
jgi:Homeodomain-like domain